MKKVLNYITTVVKAIGFGIYITIFMIGKGIAELVNHPIVSTKAAFEGVKTFINKPKTTIKSIWKIAVLMFKGEYDYVPSDYVLEVNNLSIQFGGLRAVDDFEIAIKNDELVGLIGPNGAGKTTIFNLLTGVYTPTEGSIVLKQRNLVGKNPSKIVQVGSSRTFQNIRLFKNMTVIDNIKVAYHNEMRYSLIGSIFKTGRYLRDEKKAEKTAMDLLDIFELGGYRDELAKNLPYGKQRKLEIARALATNPSLLLLDEPAAGMNPQETEELMATIRFIKDNFDVSVLLIEHDMKLVMGICERIVVIDYGKIIAKGSPKEIRTNPDVIRAYLGE